MSGYWLDVGIVCIILLSMMTALFRGFVKELIGLCVWVGAFWVAYNFSYALDPWLGFIHDRTMKTVAAYIVIVLLVLILGGIMNALICSVIRRSGLSGTDRLLGMGFGFARGVLFVAFMMVGARLAGLPYQQYNQSSALYVYFDPIVSWLSGYVPDFIKQMKGFDKETVPIGRAQDV